MPTRLTKWCRSPVRPSRRTVEATERHVLAGALAASGHSADSREPGYSWDPSLQRR